jgi:hypothetical protein
VTDDKIPRDIQRFIEQHIDSVDQLEVLLLLGAEPEREWNATGVSSALYRQPEAAAARLEALAAGGLAVESGENPPTYRLDRASADNERMVQALAHFYKHYKHAIITLIYERPRGSIRSFSDAFRIRPKE